VRECQSGSDLEYFPPELSRKSDNKLKGKTMKKIIIGLACAVIAPFAFAQTSTTTSEQTTTTAPATTTTTSTTYTSGTVATYEPGKTIVVKDEREGPVSFALHAPVRIVDKAGHVVKRALTPKDRVRVYYTGTGETRVIEHVEVED
jgi:endonuclease YncB( thermonuclease family)